MGCCRKKDKVPFMGIGQHEKEPDFVKQNKRVFAFFKLFGLFLVIWKEKYVMCKGRLMFYYFLWTLIPLLYLALGFAIKNLMMLTYKQEYKDKFDDLLEASVYSLFFGVFPAIWIYLLKRYAIHLPKILMSIIELENTEHYLNHQSKFLDVVELKKDKLRKRFFDDGDTMEYDANLNKSGCCNRFTTFIVEWGPALLCGLSMLLFFALAIAEIIVGENIGLYDQTSGELGGGGRKEGHLLILNLLYPIAYYLTVWFCVVFLEWQLKLYQTIRQQIENIRERKKVVIPEEKREEVENISQNDIRLITKFVLKMQKVFSLLSQYIFRKTIGISVIAFIGCGVFSMYKILGGFGNLFYFVPLALTMYHLQVACKFGHELMEQYESVVELLMQMEEKDDDCVMDGNGGVGHTFQDDIMKLRLKLMESPPKVVIFGGFNVNYEMLAAILTFIVSYAAIPRSLYPEKPDPVQECFINKNTSEVFCKIMS
ncbi:unnamed protein product [Meganyctiphanes norvegica]|uniref:Gustatory receptor n=1 Tax=Meganyctiphanes norvegica TaxID=48144 RepID=A0AAV2QGP0_MEGNR